MTAYSYANGAWSGGTPLPTPAGSSAFGTSVALPYTGVAAIVGDPTGGSGTGAVNVFSQNGTIVVQRDAARRPCGLGGIRHVRRAVLGRHQRDRG